MHWRFPVCHRRSYNAIYDRLCKITLLGFTKVWLWSRSGTSWNSQQNYCIYKQSTKAVFSGLYKRAVAFAKAVNATPEQPRSSSSSCQHYWANADGDTVDKYFTRNVFHSFVDRITNETERRFPHKVISILQASYFMPCYISKLDESVIRSMKQYFDLSSKDSFGARSWEMEAKNWRLR